ncbi:MAG: hypothetical protein RL685_6370 [Pseudomonadota bacterium]
MRRRAPRRTARLACLAVVSWLASAQAQVAEPSPSAAPPSPAPPSPAPPSPAPPSPAPPSPAPPPTTDTSTDADALLAELGGDPDQSALPAADPPTALALYGFADFGFQKVFLPPGSLLRTQLYEDSTFSVGNINTYLSGELGGGWRSLIEVRFTYLPNGSRIVQGGNLERASSQVADYTNAGRLRSLGGVFIERAWVDYTVNAALTLRAGSWLTPYGLWNEDHGSPTIIPVTRPYMIGIELMPERQTGLQLRGSFYVSDSVTLGYRLGLSNGRGPVSDYADLDENKALTMSLQLSHHGAGSLELGAFAYGGRYTNASESIVTTATSVLVDEQIVEQYDEIAWGLDARYLLGGLHLQTEFVINDRAFTARGRPLRSGVEYLPDERRIGGYVLAGYRFEWLGLMPYLSGGYFSYLNTYEITRPATRDVITDWSLGLNSRPTTNVTLKLEGNLGVFFVDNAKGSAFENPLKAIQAQIAWAF